MFHLKISIMVPLVKRCRNLQVDRFGHPSCRSTHVCYRCVCESTLYSTILHLGSDIHVLLDEKNFGD